MVDAEPATDPGEKAVECGDKGQNSEHIAENLASNDETEQGAFGESMQRIHGSILDVLLATVDYDTTSGQGLIQFRNPDLADCNGSRNAHHGSRDKILGRNSQADVCAHDGTGNSGESYSVPLSIPDSHHILKYGRLTRCHDEMNFRLGHEINVRFHQAS